MFNKTKLRLSFNVIQKSVNIVNMNTVSIRNSIK